MVTFDYADVYDKAWDEVISKFPTKHFVEIGAFKGDSTLHLAKKKKAGGMAHLGEFFVIDTWEGTQNEPTMMTEVVGMGEPLWDVFWKRMHAEQVSDVLYPMRVTSDDASRCFKPKSLSFVFVDGDHSYDQVCKDIKNYLPLICPGGVIAGHDFDWGTVRQAVRNTFADMGWQVSSIKVIGRCWWVQVYG